MYWGYTVYTKCNLETHNLSENLSFSLGVYLGQHQTDQNPKKNAFIC
jgi:hypothetical protein